MRSFVPAFVLLVAVPALAALVPGPLPSDTTVTVLVARRDVLPWTPIKKPEEAFEKVECPRGYEPNDAVGRCAEVKNQTLKVVRTAGQPLRRHDLLHGTNLA